MSRFLAVLVLATSMLACSGDDGADAGAKPKPRPLITETLVPTGTGGSAQSGDGRFVVTFGAGMFDRDVTLLIETLERQTSQPALLSGAYRLSVLPEAARTALNFAADLTFRGLDANRVVRVGAENAFVAARGREVGLFDQFYETTWDEPARTMSAKVADLVDYTVVDAAMLQFCSCATVDDCCRDEWNTCDSVCSGQSSAGFGGD